MSTPCWRTATATCGFATNHGVSLWRVRENRWSQLIRDDNTYLTLCETTDGRVWCGGYSTGVHLLDKRGGGRVVRSVRSLGAAPGPTASTPRWSMTTAMSGSGA